MRRLLMIAVAIAVLTAAALWAFHGRGRRLPATRSALGAKVTLRSIRRIDGSRVRLTVSVDDTQLTKRGERLLPDDPTVAVEGDGSCISNMKGIPYSGPIAAREPVEFDLSINPDSRSITIEQPVVRGRRATFLFSNISPNQLPITLRSSAGAVTLSRAYPDFAVHRNRSSHGWEWIAKDSRPPYGRRYFGLVEDVRINKTMYPTEAKVTDGVGNQLKYAGCFRRKLNSAAGHLSAAPAATWANGFHDCDWMSVFSGPDTSPKRFTYRLSMVLPAAKAVVRWENVRVPPWREQ